MRRLFTHISTAVYSQVLIYSAEVPGALWRERKCLNFKTLAKGDSNLGSLDSEYGILLLSYRAPNNVNYQTEPNFQCQNIQMCTIFEVS